MIRLKLDIEQIRHTVIHTLIDHQNTIQDCVEAETKALIEGDYLTNRIKQSVRIELDKAITQAVSQALNSWTKNSPTVKTAIQNAITDALWKES